MQEIELKLLLDEAGEARLRRAAKAFAASKGSTKRLLTRYFDTEKGDLGRAGIALRLRRQGRSWTQTVKTREGFSGGLSSAREANVSAPGGRLDIARIPEPSVRDAVEEALNGSELTSRFETDIMRTAIVLRPDEESEVELAIDHGKIRAGERSCEFREAEFELVTGNASAVFAAARALFPSGGLVLSTMSKAERGARLLGEGDIGTGVGIRDARDVEMTSKMTSEEAAGAVLSECLEQVAANVAAACAGDAAEGPHQLRIGLRRLRTAFRIFRPALDGPDLRRLAEEARWLGQEVGRLRDLDVLLHDLVRPEAKAAPEEPGFATLCDAVESRGREVRAGLRETLAGERVQRFLFDLVEFVALRGWLDPSDLAQTQRLARPVGELATESLEHCLKRVTSRAAKIETLDLAARHELRKELKKLRYTIEFFAPLYPSKKVKAMLKPLKLLQEIFGHLNDVATAEALFIAPDAPAGWDPAAMRAAGRVIGASVVRADDDWHEAKARWKGLKTVKPFWR